MAREEKSAFTLVELLTVIVVVGLLASAVVPMLSRAKTVARQVACADNLHDIGVGCGAYNAGERKPIPVDTWTIALKPFVPDQDVFICPETDKPGAQKIDLRSLYVREKNEWDYSTPTVDWPLEPDLKEGERSLWAWEMIKKDATGFTIGMSDSWNNQYDDLVLRFDYLGGNMVKVTYVSEDTAFLTYDLMGPNGMILEGMGKGGKNGAKFGMSATFGAALATYGMNSLTRSTSIGRNLVLVLDYDKPIANCAGPEATDVWEEWAAPRHMGHCNVLFGDGSVQSMYPGRLDPAAPDAPPWVP